MAKSTRQYVFEGMEILPEALIPFVEKRLESALTGHWQVRVAEKLRLHAGPNGAIAGIRPRCSTPWIGSGQTRSGTCWAALNDQS